MTDRFSPRALLTSAINSVRRRQLPGVPEPRDIPALVILAMSPALAAAASMCFGWRVTKPDSLIAAFALLGAALLAVVPQLSSWRQATAQRGGRFTETARNRLDEAVAWALVATMSSVTLAGLAAVTANTAPDPAERSWWPLTMSAILVGGSVFLLTALMLVVNLLWLAYTDINEIEDEAAKREANYR